MLSNTLRLNFLLHENYSHSSFTLSSKKIGHILKNKQKKNCVCINEIIRLIIIKMKMKMKNRSHRYDRNTPRSRHGYKYSEYKNCLSITMLTCIKQHLSTKKLSRKKALLLKKIVHTNNVIPVTGNIAINKTILAKNAYINIYSPKSQINN